MDLTEEKSEEVLPESTVECAPVSRFEQLKALDWRGTLLTLGLSVGVLLATGSFKTVLAIAILLSSVISLVKRQIRTFEQSQQPTKDEPPRYLLLVAAFVLPSDSREAALGDMEEKYNKAVTRFGRKWSNCLMARDILGSIFPKLINLTRKMLFTALKAIGLYEVYRRFKG